jgi:NADH-quinone oxidoreductase subunit E
MAHLSTDTVARAKSLIALYPQKRSALLPLCHLAQAQDGWLTPEAMEDIAGLLDITPAEVRGSASFYDMLHTEPVGTYVVAVCTNIACMLAGAYELLEHAEHSLGVHPGGTTRDGMFTLEEMECLAACDTAPCVQVNHRFFGPLDGEGFDDLVDDLRTGKLSSEVPPHGVLCRYERRHGLEAAGAASRPRPATGGGASASPAGSSGDETAGSSAAPPAAAPPARRARRSASTAGPAAPPGSEAAAVVSPPRGGVSLPAPAGEVAPENEHHAAAEPEPAPKPKRGLGSLAPLTRRRKPERDKPGKGGEPS